MTSHRQQRTAPYWWAVAVLGVVTLMVIGWSTAKPDEEEHTPRPPRVVPTIVVTVYPRCPVPPANGVPQPCLP